MLALLVAILGTHAADAQLHAADPEAAWVRAPVSQVYTATTPALTRRVYGYLPYWSSIDLNTFHWDLVSDVIAFSAGVGTDGTISNSHALPGAALVSAAHAHGVKIHLCATLFNSSGGSEISTFLGSSAARTKAVQQLVAIANNAGLDGLNLDFEFVSSGSKTSFTAFVQELKGAAPALEISIAMPSSVGYTGYDTAALAAAAGKLLLMEYDWHWRTAPTSGANSPLPPVENAVAGFLNAGAPAASVAVGVPYYGYDWPTATSSPGSATSGAGNAVMFSAVFGKFSSYGRLWDSASQTPWYRYAASGQEHQGWVDDDQSLALKYQYVKSKDLAGVMIWALGYDEPRTEAWDALRTAFQSAPQPPPTAPGVLQIVSANFSPSTVAPGQPVTLSVHVKNVGGQTIAATTPAPSMVYDEPDSAPAATGWRLAADVADRPASQPERPWRWGLASALAPGAEADMSAQIKLERAGTRTLWAAVIDEGAGTTQDFLAQTDLTVTSTQVQPDAGTPASDAGAVPNQPPPPEARAGGCSQSGPGLWCLVLLLGLLARLRSESQRR